MVRHLNRLGASVGALALIAGGASAETLASDRKLTVVLDDGTDVILYGSTRNLGDGKREYYYLPPALSISENEEGRPEFLFMKFITDEDADAGGISGAILHFLVDWGLSPEQEGELAELIETEHNGELAGAATMYPSAEEGPSFYIVSATVGDEEIGSRLVTSGQASLVPGGKAAAASRLDNYAAQILAETFEEEATISDLTAVMNMEYAVQVQGVKGSVSINWSKIERESETIDADYTRSLEGEKVTKKCFIVWCRDNVTQDYVYDYDEVRSQFEYLAENEYINFRFEQGNIPEEIAAPVRDAFLQYFIAQVTNATEPTPAPARTEEEEGEDENFDIKKGAGYTYDVTKTRSLVQRGTQRLNLDMKLTVRYPFQLVGNMKSWYADAVDDPYAVQDVILNDPYFQRREILFVLDGDVKDMFEEQVNLVTVEIEKDRPEGDFTDSVTFTNGALEERGKLGRVTYARGASANSGTYKYRVNWNFREGRQYTQPESGWAEGSWEGVTLAAPIESRVIELEGDLDELSNAGVTRVTAQIRYPVLGEEEETNIQLSVSGDEPLVNQQIFTDRNGGGYVYRLVLNHKRLGRLALPWSRRESDNYIYASLPGELVDDLINDVVEGVVSTAKDAVESEAGDQLRKFDILAGED